MIRAGVRCKVLGDEAADRIHAAAMQVLEQTGVEVEHDGGLEILRSAGAVVEGTRARIGSELVDEAVRRAPKEIILGDREGSPAMTLAGDRVHFGTGSDCIFVREGGLRRKAVLEDVRRFARLADRLGEIDFVMSMACPSDVPAERLYREEYAAMLLESSKPKVFTVVDPAELAPILEISVAAQGSRAAHEAAPHLLLYAEPVSPLKHIETSVTKLLYCAENGIPVTYSPGSMGGGTTPVTGAGAVVQSTAEILSGLVISQFARPGAKFVFGGAVGAMDMRTMVNVYCAPFGALWGAALAEMGQRYGLPTWSTAGCSDSKLVDCQAAVDSSLMTLFAAMNSANLVHDVGYIESGLTSSPEMLVISAEIIAVAGRSVEALDVSDDSLAVDAIARVGPGGEFLTDDHTLDNFRREAFVPGIMDYRNFGQWEEAGSTSMIERASARVEEILGTAAECAMDDARREQVLDILR